MHSKPEMYVQLTYVDEELTKALGLISAPPLIHIEELDQVSWDLYQLRDRIRVQLDDLSQGTDLGSNKVN